MTAPFADLRDDESSLADDADARILWLVTERLEHMGTAEGGWDQLFRDPRDGRWWELTFPHGSLFGGGARSLRVVDDTVAASKYGVRT